MMSEMVDLLRGRGISADATGHGYGDSPCSRYSDFRTSAPLKGKLSAFIRVVHGSQVNAKERKMTHKYNSDIIKVLLFCQ